MYPRFFVFSEVNKEENLMKRGSMLLRRTGTLSRAKSLLSARIHNRRMVKSCRLNGVFSITQVANCLF